MIKKYLMMVGVIGGLLLILTVGILLAKKMSGGQAAPTPTPQTTIETPLEERPYISLTPTADAHQFTLVFPKVNFGNSVDYEFTYQTNADLTQGAIGTIDLAKEQYPINRKFLLGACSKNVCRYDEGVQKGNLTLKFRDEQGIRKFSTDFHLQKGDSQLTSTDEAFKLSGKISPAPFYITLSTIGLPKPTDGQVIAGPYGVFSSSPTAIKSGSVAVSLPEGTKTSASFLYWDNQSWVDLKGKIEGNTITASSGSLGTYVVTSKK